MTMSENKENDYDSDPNTPDSPVGSVTAKFNSILIKKKKINASGSPHTYQNIGKGKPPLGKSTKQNIPNPPSSMRRSDPEGSTTPPTSSLSSPNSKSKSTSSPNSKFSPCLSRSPPTSKDIALPPAPPPSPCNEGDTQIELPSSPSLTKRCKSEMDIKGLNISRRSSIDYRNTGCEAKPIQKIRRTSICENPKPYSSGLGIETTCSSLSQENESTHENKPLDQESPAITNEEKHLPLSTRKLPYFTVGDPNMKKITHETLVELLDGKYSDIYSKVHVVDCRFQYEYEGGHIKGAVNIDTNVDLIKHFFQGKLTLNSKECVVFHCEFSSHRGPKMMKFMREYDRRLIGVIDYPNLYYPDIFVLHEGYKNFFTHNKDFCEPKEYIPMKHPDHDKDRKVCVPKNQNQWKKNMHRSLSFDGYDK